MNKINGLTSEFALVKEEGSRTVISYGFKAEQGGKNATWYEVYFPKKQGKPNLEAVKKAVIADINARTDEKIINGYPFTPDGAEEPIIVWLSKESQMDFSEAHRLQIVPVKFKLNETPDNQPIYHTFETFEELNRFYTGGVQYINQCLNEGWAEKDGIDWTPYEQALNPQPEQSEDKKSTRKK